MEEKINIFIREEEARLGKVCEVADLYRQSRKQKISEYAQEIRSLEADRLGEMDPREKDRITREIRDKAPYDPTNYTPAFEYSSTPYLAGLIIEDDEPRIGKKHYLFGKQGLADVRNQAQVVIDWRKAAISKLFYEWDEGEGYEEEIAGQERTGIINKKISYRIKNQELLTIKTGSDVLSKQDGQWVGQGDQKNNTTMVQKEASGDFSMVDIVSLISKEQFRLITQNHSGCIYLTGGAGSGKTTVALHRLSYLLFNYPEQYRPERCLVVMFNRSLRDYVHQTSQDLLTNKLPVETFHSWASRALASLGFKGQFGASQGKGLGALKKSVGLYKALTEYVQTTDNPGNGVKDLGLFYSCQNVLSKHLAGRYTKSLSGLYEQGQGILAGSSSLAFEDAGILLHLVQLRNPDRDFQGVSGWYDHILIDEAQDLSLVELKSLYAATSKQKSMTVCADEKQKILDFVDGEGFSSFQFDLKEKGLAQGELSVSYRSTKQIMALASKVSGREVQEVATEGPEPRVHRFASESQALEHLQGSVRVLLEREPKSLSAIICRYKKEADLVYRAIKHLPGVRLQTGRLSFQPGLIVVNVHQVKGLEFPGVILWNPSAKNYPKTENGKNLLYVAITRASQRLALYCIGDDYF